LLTFARIGVRPIAQGVVDLGEVVAASLEDLAEGIKATGAVVDVDLPSTAAWGDASLIRSLFVNILDNALKYRAPGVTPHIRITVEETDDGYQVAVADNGIGIEPKYQEKVFALFQRLHSQEEYPGTGIGLATAKKIVNLHNGRIWFESRGNGTTFYFTLPAAKERVM